MLMYEMSGYAWLSDSASLLVKYNLFLMQWRLMLVFLLVYCWFIIPVGFIE